MNRFLPTLPIILLGIFFATSAPSAIAASPPGPALRETLAEGNAAFGVKLYGNLGAEGGNLFFSPYSISTALGMTYAGARGNTAKEIREVLHFGFEPPELNAAFRSLTRELADSANRAGQKLNVANALVLTGGDVSGEYKKVLKDDYGAEIFGGGLEKINGWVSRKTEGKIGKILEELDPDSVCVILNAIYFKGSWENPFRKRDTRDAPFSVSASRQVTVPLMSRKGGFRILAGKDFQALSIPYKGKNLSMVVLLPNRVDGLASLEKEVTSGSLKGWLAELDRQEVRKAEIHLPRFKLETGYDLVSSFKTAGMKDSFGNAADFTGMGWPKGKLYISQIKHKAFLEVNEEGTEAAAATAVEMSTKSAAFDEPVFRADHPFLFIIRDNPSGAILFMGRLADPGNASRP